jgi:hypothetical protein
VVELLRHPVDGGAAGLVGPVIDRLDERPAEVTAAECRIDVEVLEIAHVLDLPAVLVEEVVHQPGRLAVGLHDQPEDRSLVTAPALALPARMRAKVERYTSSGTLDS